MQRLSSSLAIFYKRVFPSIMFAVIAIFFLVSLSQVNSNEIGVIILLFPLAMAAICYLVMKCFVWNLVDEVWDHDDFLIVKNKSKEVRIDLLDVEQIKHSNFVNPTTVSIILRKPREFGRIVKFTPPFRLITLGRPPVATELIRRINSMRRS
ncbi:MAG: hypothetical protein ACON4R_13670 [Akkermansiaceae bacterium]